MPLDSDDAFSPDEDAWLRSLLPERPKPIDFHTAEPNDPEEDSSVAGGIYYSASLEYRPKAWMDFEVTAEEHRIIVEYGEARRRQEKASAAAAAARWKPSAPPLPPREPEPEEISATGKLTPRQAEFCRHYAAQPVATRAAVLAGFSDANASPYGSRLLKNTLVLDRIAQLRAEKKIHYVLERDTMHDKLEALFSDALGERNHAAAVSALKLQAALAGMFQHAPAKEASDDAHTAHARDAGKARKSQGGRAKKPRKAKVRSRQKPGKAKKS